jgi:hypothetical protein
MKIIERKQVSRQFQPGNSYFNIDWYGETLLSCPVEKSLKLNEVIIFTLEDGDFGIKGKEGIGGTFIFLKD